jgi:hypothetical protein
VHDEITPGQFRRVLVAEDAGAVFGFHHLLGVPWCGSQQAARLNKNEAIRLWQKERMEEMAFHSVACIAANSHHFNQTNSQ